MTYDDTISPNSGTLVRDKLWFDDGFTMIPNAWIRDEKLSYGARGMAAYLVSHDPGFEVSIEFLARRSPNGRDAVTGFIAELERFGYLKRYRGRERGRFGRIKWHLRDPFMPQNLSGQVPLDLEELQPLRSQKSRSEPQTGLPHAVQPYVDKPHAVIPGTIEEHLKNTINTSKDNPSTGAGNEEDASGDDLFTALHARCAFFARGHRECNWAPSGYCENCGRTRPSMIPVAVSHE